MQPLNLSRVLKIENKVTEGKTKSGLDKFIPEKKGTTTLHSLVKKDSPGQFHDAQCDASLMTKRDERQLVGWVLTKALEVSYRSHHYTSGGEIFRQRYG